MGYRVVRGRLTPQFLQELHRALGPGDRVEAWDTALPGFVARVSKRGIVYQVRYSVRGRGRRPRFRVGAAPQVTLADARAEARRILARVELDGDPQRERQAQQQQSEDLLGVCRAFVEAPPYAHKDKQPLAPATLKEYRRMLRAYVEAAPPIARRTATDLRLRDAREWLNDVAERHGAAQANRLFQLVRAAFKWARRDELLATNPLEGLQRPRAEAPRERVLSDDEIDVLWTVLDGEAGSQRPAWRPTAGDAVKVLLLLGQRCGETLEMRWEDLGLAARPAVWTIPGRHRKGGRLHVVPLPPLAVRIIEGLRPGDDPEGRVFRGVSTGNAERDWWGALRTKAITAGVAPWTRHDLRRTCATGCARLGAAPEVVSRILGHAVHPGGAPVTGTYDRYDRLPEKAAALVAWAAHVEAVVTGRRRGDVLPFGR